ncbi:Putative aliphatic sulfonates transport permease protein SsuC [Sporomusa silvacetica DSM 10669]|uniref:Aliphatic sulfonates transport permease protein SsuC n=1 Tax=Sporomusa silvacetica DSM 10669 TaxID=1123289 RepID=A0ABZ3IH61_9FIRM|nr:ABC transporter permease [Sporomusa silvacetica]OZC14843.1 putative aliphatic sulfonates transport permease protein SsuC [Sporomusa silvacetica DSM 10669]
MEGTLKKVVLKTKGGGEYGKALSGVRSLLVDNLSIIVFLIIWEAAPRVGLVPQTFISPPSIVLSTLWDLVADGVLLIHVKASLLRAVFGFVLAAVIGIPLGFFLGGGFRLFERIVTPLLRLLAEVNPFSLFPVFILIFGIGEISKVSMIFWVCLWPILLNTITGVKNVDELLIKSARSMGVKAVDMFFKVVLPAASPGIFHGLKTSCNTAFFMLIAAEMIGASSGLGWLVFNAQNNYQIPKLFATTVTISALGLSLNYLFTELERRIINWKESEPDY